MDVCTKPLMHASAVRPRVNRRPAAAAFAVVATILALSMAGGALALQRSGLVATRAAGSASSTHVVGDDVKTSFGIVAVEYVRTVEGVSSRALAGASHGVSGLVDDDHVRIQTAVAITNRIQRPISYKIGQFRLLVTRHGKTTIQAPSGGDLPNMRVLPHAGIEGHLDFTVPRSGAALAMEFLDRGSDEPIIINLGQARFTRPAGTSSGHAHG